MRRLLIKKKKKILLTQEQESTYASITYTHYIHFLNNI